MTEDLRKNLHRGIDSIQQDIVRLSALVAEGVVAGTGALLGSNMDAAQAIIDADDVLDELTNDIEERCFGVLALEQPMASDLRSVTGSLRIASDLERAGDLVVNIMKGARRMYGQDLPVRLRGIIQQMSDESARLIRLAADAYAERNGALGSALNDIDNRLDELQRDFIAAMFDAHTNGECELPQAVQLALIARYYERIGDHAVNIGERVAFIATGSLPDYAAIGARGEAPAGGAGSA
jgi:phosphate transport system protein